MQGGTSHTTPGAAAERCFGSAVLVQIGDTPQWHPARVDAQRRQVGQAGGHQALAAGLVDRSVSRFCHDHRKPLLASIYRRSETGRAAADDQQVGIVRHRQSSAEFSTLIRTVCSSELARISRYNRTYQPSSTSSAEKPRPMAIISPMEPGGWGSVMVTWRISSTIPDDRFPFSRRDFRL